MPAPNTTTFTAAEIEKMRLYVTEHDKQTAANVFDLNNPPRTNYVHQSFPKLVYDLDDDGNRIHLIVHDAEEHEAALAAGWANEPKAPEEAEELDLNPATAAEAAQVDARLKGKGRQKAKTTAKAK
jgi:hypothetical protein